MKKTNIEKLNKFINKNEFKINEKLILNSLKLKLWRKFVDSYLSDLSSLIKPQKT